MRDYLRRLLSDQYTVEAVANGLQALDAIRRPRPDLVLSDVMMPELDGFGLLRELRTDPATSSLPIILLSARAGADDYLVKPFSARDVLSRVAARLEIVRTRAAADTQTRDFALTEATRHMNEFLGIASHELRTPLTSITGNLQLARRQLQGLMQRVPGKASESLRPPLERSELLLERAGRQAGRLDRLVGDLLDITRIEAGKLAMRRELYDVLAIVGEAVQEQRMAWPRRSIAFDLPRRTALPLVFDGDRIGQVLTNYLTNALKYSSEDQPVAVRVRIQAGSVRVEVHDAGPGLPASQQAHLFERFYRAPGIEQQSGSGIGLGLGLYISKTIVERHGGAVGVESAVGTGSTFWFTLPLSCDE
jgi:signal transduction histidine kinase